ncbi:alkaline phosphatase D family protein [Glaciecola siphonariae]|uniref:Alkaline phosphatase D family protein n=1 Tax=Glaciecola siphonariae TaxID=521012 RepID=A0ABV9LVM4_9ALTE
MLKKGKLSTSFVSNRLTIGLSSISRAVSSVAIGAVLIASTTYAQASEFTIAFGSCAYDSEPQPIWTDIAAMNPDLFLFIGDNQYADVQFDEQGKAIRGPVTDPARFKEAYDAVAAKPEFAAFRASTPIMGTWDDHDYGANDAGKEFPLKAESQEAFLDFFGFAKDDPIRQQAGIYHSKIIEDDGRKVQVIMLDTRYHRDELKKVDGPRPQGFGSYLPSNDTSKSLLGAEQWTWLSEQLLVPADVRIIVSSIQVVAYEHRWESWGNLPHERDRLYALIEKSKANNVFFLSGDRHLMEISRDTGQKGSKVPYPIWDFTSSGMTQKYSEVNEANTFRVSEVVRDTHYGIVEIDWEDDLKQSKVTFTAYGLGNRVFDSASFKLAELTLDAPSTDSAGLSSERGSL